MKRERAGLLGPATEADDEAAWPGAGKGLSSPNPSSFAGKAEAIKRAESGASPVSGASHLFNLKSAAVMPKPQISKIVVPKCRPLVPVEAMNLLGLVLEEVLQQ